MGYILTSCGGDRPSGPDDSTSTNKSPTAEISFPSDSSTFTETDTIGFRGSGEDPEDGTLTGRSLTWESSLDGQLGTGASFETSGLSAGNHEIVLTVTDSDSASDSDSVRVTVEEVSSPPQNAAPNAKIASPADSSTFTESDTIAFKGSGEDREDGTLTGRSLTWESSLDGQLGTGASFETSGLSAGNHEIVLTVTDSDSASDSDSVRVTVEEVAPSVSLGVKLPRPDLDFSDSATAAHKEAVVLAWTTQNEPDTCRASGSWSGSKSLFGGRDTTSSLNGPDNLSYVIQCENSGGSDTDTAYVSVGAPGEVHATSNRPDLVEKPLLKLFYLIPKDVEDKELDLNGFMELQFHDFQNRFDSLKNTYFRVDRYSRGYDIAFVRLDSTRAEFEEDIGNADQIIRGELKERGFDESRTDDATYLVLYDNGERDSPVSVCGVGGFGLAIVWSVDCMQHDGVPGHEVVHALGMVDEDAPNYDEGSHVTGPEEDLMDAVVPHSFLIDPGCDDYYCESGLPSDIQNLAESPFLITN